MPEVGSIPTFWLQQSHFCCQSHVSVIWHQHNTANNRTRCHTVGNPLAPHAAQLCPSGFGMNSAFGSQRVGDYSSYHKAQVGCTLWQGGSFSHFVCLTQTNKNTHILGQYKIHNSSNLLFFGFWEKAWHSQTHPSYPSQLQYCVLCVVDLRRGLIEEYNQCIHYIGCIGSCKTNQRMEALLLVVCKGSFVCAFINLSANLICWFCGKLQFNTSHSRWIVNVFPCFSIKHSDCIPTFSLSLSLSLPLSLWPCQKETLTHSGQNRTVSDMV